MIPKVLHYCWLSGEVLPPWYARCIASWKEKMPDYEIVLWDRSRFDVESVPFVREACAVGKWAFAADYIRLHALYTEGGIYLDSDVFVNKRLDPYLDCGMFTSVEYHPAIVARLDGESYLRPDGSPKDAASPPPGIGIQAAVLGARPGHGFLDACLDYYRGESFILEDGTYHDHLIAPTIYAMVAQRRGFRYVDELQHLPEDMVVHPSRVFAGNAKLADDESVAVHCCAGGWRDDDAEPKQATVAGGVLERLKRSLWVRRLFGKGAVPSSRRVDLPLDV